MAEAQPRKHALSENWAVREVDHLFARLGYYTRFVGYSKWMLGVLALVLLVSLIAWPLLTKDRSGLRVSFVQKDGSKPEQPATSPVMNNPQYTGITARGEQFVINGLRATQVTPAMMDIEIVTAHIIRLSGGWASVTADRAVYNKDKKTVELTGNVTVMDDRGYTFVTPSATIDTETSNVKGNQPVSGSGPMGKLLASGFEIMDSGSRIIFLGGEKQVRLDIDRAGK